MPSALYHLAVQVLGGAISLGLNASNDKAGKVSYTVYLVSIALQCTGPVVALFLTPPSKVERTDGKKVDLSIPNGPWHEIKETTRLFFTKEWLLIVLFIGQAGFDEAVYFTYLSLWFTVRARALASFLCGIVAVICGNLAGHFLDWKKLSLKVRTRTAFALIVICQGGWWIWATVLVTRYRVTQPTFDWTSDGFGAGFGIFVLLGAGFQVNYLYLYFIVSNLSKDPEQVIRYASLLRGTESAWQAISYWLSSVHVFAVVGGVYLNFGLWAVSILPAWLVIRLFGTL